MGMWTTENQDTLSDVLRKFSEAGRTVYGDHAFEAGYMQSVIISMLSDLPKRKQQEVINDMHRATWKLEARAAEKIKAS